MASVDIGFKMENISWNTRRNDNVNGYFLHAVAVVELLGAAATILMASGDLGVLWNSKHHGGENISWNTRRNDNVNGYFLHAVAVVQLLGAAATTLMASGDLGFFT